MNTIDFICHDWRKPEKWFETVEIYPISDLHVGSQECDIEKFIKWRDKILERENRFILLGGDLIDNATKNSVASTFESTMTPKQQIDYVIDLLRPVKGRILGMVSGNHENRSNRDANFDPTYWIAMSLGIEHLYRRELAVININLTPSEGGYGGKGRVRPNYLITLTHGAGGGGRIGSGANRMEQFARSFQTDVLVTGHTHKPVSAPLVGYVADKSKKVMVPQLTYIMCATGWLKYGGYPTEKMLNPVPIAPNYAILDGTYKAVQIVQS